MLNVGVIGLAWAGQFHLSGYSSLKDVKIYAISEMDETILKATSGKYNIPHTFTDYHKLLQLKELNVVSICVPNYLHYPITILNPSHLDTVLFMDCIK